MQVQQEDQVAAYLELQHQLAAAKAAMRAVVNQPRHVLPFLQPGRLVNIAARASGTPNHSKIDMPDILTSFKVLGAAKAEPYLLQ